MFVCDLTQLLLCLGMLVCDGMWYATCLILFLKAFTYTVTVALIGGGHVLVSMSFIPILGIK